MILRPRPALARKAAVSNPGFSSLTIERPPSDCGPCRMTTGGMLDHTATRLTKLVCSVERTIDCERNHGMPDLLHATKHSRHSLRLHTLIQTLAHGRTCGGEILCNFAHSCGNIFAPPQFRFANMESDKTRRGSRRQSNPLESIIAAVASRYKAKRHMLRKN